MAEDKSVITQAEILMTTRQAAELLQLKETTLEQWRWCGKGPQFVKVGRCVRYRQADLDAFLDARVFTSTTAAQHSEVVGTSATKN